MSALQWIRDKLADASEATRAQIVVAIGWFARVAVISAMTALATRGWITNDDVQQAGGIAVGIVALGVSYLATRKKEKKVQELKQENRELRLTTIDLARAMNDARRQLREQGVDPDSLEERLEPTKPGDEGSGGP